MSTEWPEFLCLSFNDTFYTIVETEAVNGGAPSNISYDPQSRPITVNVGFFELPREWTTPLGNTPYGAPDGSGYCPSSSGNCVLPDYCTDHPVGGLDYEGSGSGWLKTSAPVLRTEETIQVKFTIHDESDGIYDSLVIIDNFRWTPFTPEVGTVKETPDDSDPFDWGWF